MGKMSIGVSAMTANIHSTILAQEQVPEVAAEQVGQNIAAHIMMTAFGGHTIQALGKLYVVYAITTILVIL